MGSFTMEVALMVSHTPQCHTPSTCHCHLLTFPEHPVWLPGRVMLATCLDGRVTGWAVPYLGYKKSRPDPWIDLHTQNSSFYSLDRLFSGLSDPEVSRHLFAPVVLSSHEGSSLVDAARGLICKPWVERLVAHAHGSKLRLWQAYEIAHEGKISTLEERKIPTFEVSGLVQQLRAIRLPDEPEVSELHALRLKILRKYQNVRRPKALLEPPQVY